MPLTLNGTTGVSGIDGTAGTPAAQGSDTNTGVFYGTDTVSISTGGTARVVVNSDGQTVLGAGTASLPAMSTTGDLNTGTFYPAADTIGWTTGGTERARITSAGELLVGLTSVPAGVPGTVFSKNTQNPFVCWNPATSGNNGFMDFATEGTYTERGYLYYNRAAGQTQLSATSDIRLKENIVDAPSAFPVINSIKVRQFDWKETSNTNIGFIAQELYDVVPQAVAVGEDNADGSIKRHWGVSKEYLVPYLVKAIQELSAKLDAAEARIAALEAK